MKIFVAGELFNGIPYNFNPLHSTTKTIKIMIEILINFCQLQSMKEIIQVYVIHT